MPPAPKAALRYPTQPSPRSRTSSARTTNRMSSAPQSRNSPMQQPHQQPQVRVLAQRARSPRAPRQRAALVVRRRSAAGRRLRATSSAETSATPAMRPKTRSTPATASRTPASALASSTPPLSTQLETTFVAVELLRRAGQRRHDHGLRRPGDRHGRGRDHRARVDDGHRRVGDDRDRRHAHRPRPAPDSRRRARAPAGGGRRAAPGTARQTAAGTSCRTATKLASLVAPALEREHEHGDPDRELRGVEAGERQLHAAQVAVARGRRGRHVPCPRSGAPRGPRAL